MAISYVNHFIDGTWGPATGPFTTNAYTVGAGDFLLLFGGCNNGTGITLGGFSQTPGGAQTILTANPVSSEGASWIGAYLVAPGGSQTITLTSTGADNMVGYGAYEYSGVVSATCNTQAFSSTTPFTATGVTVPVGSTLLAICADIQGGVSSITASNGTHNLNGTQGGPWASADYVGTGAVVTPSFTPNVSGSALMALFMLTGAAAATGPAPIYYQRKVLYWI